MDTRLEDKIGYKIHNLVRKGDMKYIKQAAELAYQEFGFVRAIRIYNNAGRITESETFAEKHGHLKELVGIYLFQGQFKEAKKLAKKLGVLDLANWVVPEKKIGPPLKMDYKKRVRKDLETEISPSETEISIPKAEIEAEA